MNSNAIIVRYGEISLKGKNRSQFEKQLQDNIQLFLRRLQIPHTGISRLPGRLYIHGCAALPPLQRVFGVHSFSPALEMVKDYQRLQDMIPALLPGARRWRSFRISCQRVDKTFPLTSLDVERDIGRIVLEKTGIPVDLERPELTLHIEIGHRHLYVFNEKITAYGGFPFGSAGKLVALISGGIDSPVATFLMMKRGVEPLLLHFSISASETEKVLRLKAKLEEYVPNGQLSLQIIPRSEIFRDKFAELLRGRYHSYTCVLCKYLMHRQAGEIARTTGALGIITGDNLGQVASQTLKNMISQRRGSDFPIYSPLIACEKVDTINLAKAIGTYEISISPSTGCTPPANPKTGVEPERLQQILNQTGLG